MDSSKAHLPGPITVKNRPDDPMDTAQNISKLDKQFWRRRIIKPRAMEFYIKMFTIRSGTRLFHDYIEI